MGGAFYELGPSHEPEGAEKEKGEAAFWAPTMAMIASTTKAIVHTKPFPRAFAFFFYFFLHCRARAEYPGAYDLSMAARSMMAQSGVNPEAGSQLSSQLELS